MPCTDDPAESVSRILAPLVAISTLLAPASAVAQAEEGPSEPGPITEMPRGCELLTPEDAAEILEEEVVSSGETDVAHFNCTFLTSSERRLVFTGFIGTGSAIEDAQPGIHVRHCGSAVVAEVDDLGADAALLRDAEEDEYACGGYRLWVVTDVRFRGRLNPDLVRETEGPFHLVFEVAPVEQEERIEILRRAARRVLDRLGS